MIERHKIYTMGRTLFILMFCLVVVALSTDTLMGQTRNNTFPANSYSNTSYSNTSYSNTSYSNTFVMYRDITQVPIQQTPIQAPASNGNQNSTKTSSLSDGGIQSISIEEITSLAITNNPAIRQATEQVNSYQGSMIQAGLKKNPMAGYVADEMGGYKGAGRQGIALSQEIVPEYKLAARQSVVGAEQNAAMQGLEIQRQKVINDATIAGYRLLITQNKEVLIRELLSICEKSAEVAGSLLKANEVPKTDYLQAKIELNKAKMSLGDVQLEREAISKEITLLLNAPEGTFYKITDSLDRIPIDLDENSLFQRLLEQSPQFRRAQAELSVAQSKIQKERMEAGIEVNVEGSVVYNTYEKQTEVSAGFNIPLRINDKNQGNIMRAQYEIQAAVANIERIKTALKTSFQNKFAQFNIARQRVRFYQEGILAEVDESLKLILQSYQQGQCSYIELLNAQRTMFNTKVEYMDSVGALLDCRAMINGYLLQGAYDRPE